MLERVHDYRAFIGAISLLIVGMILSLMVAFYMLPDHFPPGILGARWWWEIVLNLQILCAACMWFCHHDRMALARGGWRVRAVANFLVGVVAISYPVGVLMIGAWRNWFHVAPTPDEVMTVMIAGILLWLAGTFIVPLFQRYTVGQQPGQPVGPGGVIRRLVRQFWATALVMLIIIYEIGHSVKPGYIVVPMLMYIQGALPYLKKAKHASPRDSEM